MEYFLKEKEGPPWCRGGKGERLERERGEKENVSKLG